MFSQHSFIYDLTLQRHSIIAMELLCQLMKNLNYFMAKAPKRKGDSATAVTIC
jgi:hypothetical protein